MNSSAIEVDEQLPRILFVDDEEDVLRHLTQSISSLGYDVISTLDWDEARDILKQPNSRPEIILIEPLSKAKGGSYSLQEVCSQADRIPVVVLSSSRDPRIIVEAMRAGVQDYICKPLEPVKLGERITRILDQGQEDPAEVEVVPSASEEFVFCSPQMEEIGRMVDQISATKVPVLILGESGVGKEVVARWVHQKSALRNRPFVKVNCAAMPSELVESELFGYRKGAFTGAHVDRPGKFEFASGGTIFLDEIGEFSSSIQAKLLQVLQEGRFMRLGSNRETEADVRVIAATNRKLEEGIKDGSFREDLYYRLNVVNITVPPLRDRREEIPVLSQHFLNKLGPQYASDVRQLPEKLEKLFQAYHWPGNVRELENLIKRFLVLQDAESIQKELEAKMTRGVSEQIDEITEGELQGDPESLDLKETSRKAAAVAEKSMILITLRRSNWNRWKAAKELRISYKTLLTKIERYDIRPTDSVA